MSRAVPVTKAQLRRAIEAAHEAGMRVKGIAPDGTLLLEERDQMERHYYRPSALHMGDCDICGHVQHSPLHIAQGEDRQDGKPRDHVL